MGVTSNGVRAMYGAPTAEERREKLLPFIWGVMAKEGQVFGHAESGSLVRVTNGKNFSYPGYNELLTGAADDRIDSNNKKNNPNINVLEWLETQKGFKNKVAAFTSWDVFPYILNVERNGLPVNSAWQPITVASSKQKLEMFNAISADVYREWSGVRFDVFTQLATEEYIKAKKPRVIYVSFGETDDWAHGNKYKQYLDSAKRTDDFIRRLWELLQSMRQYKDKTTLILATDHGRGDTTKDWQSHGEEIAGCDRIWMAAMGAGVPAKGIVSGINATQSQFAPTAAHLLGFDFSTVNPKSAKPLPFE